MPFKTNLNFEEDETKELLSELEFEYFLKQNIIDAKYLQEDVDDIYNSYSITLIELKERAKKNKKQFHLYLEGNVRRMFTGGFLTALFLLDEGREQRFFDFKAIGENWAYFQVWSKRHKRIVKTKKIWDIVVKAGSFLAIILTIIKVIEIITGKKMEP